jgi:hypothetical protein
MNTILRLALAVIIGVIVTALLDNYWVGHALISFLLGVLAFLLVYFGDPLARRPN